jgi:ribose transport system substrate-binding protein
LCTEHTPRRSRTFRAVAAVINAGLLIASSASPALAHGRLFGILGKSNDVNFVEVTRGCNDQARSAGDRCVLIATNGSSHPRLQSELIARTIASGQYDAFAVSVTEAGLVGDALRAVSVPLITFDSPLAGPKVHEAPAYLGIDNTEFGRDMARLALKLRPQGGKVCIITSMNHVNLLQRIAGVRQVLSNDPNFPSNSRLNGEGGWTEATYCPFDARDNEARSLVGMAVAIRNSKADVVISLGHWPIGNPASYRTAMEPYQERLMAGTTNVIVAVGTPSAEQSRLLTDRLVHGIVTINFNALGRLCYRHLKALVEKQPPPQTRTLPYDSIRNNNMKGN